MKQQKINPEKNFPSPRLSVIITIETHTHITTLHTVDWNFFNPNNTEQIPNIIAKIPNEIVIELILTKVYYIPVLESKVFIVRRAIWMSRMNERFFM
jgi:hypothetical protein